MEPVRETRFLRDILDRDNNMSGPETEKVMIETVRRIQKIFFGRPGALSYVPYHEPGYYRSGRGTENRSDPWTGSIISLWTFTPGI